MRRVNWKALLVQIALAEAVGLLAGLFTMNARELYATLEKPPLSPPGWVFPVVWTVLYALMGIAAYLILEGHVPREEKEKAALLYGLQLLVNFLWTLVFFGLRQYGFAVGVIAVLVVLLCWTMLAFYPIDRRAALLLVPYLLWVLFATYLNIAIFLLN